MFWRIDLGPCGDISRLTLSSTSRKSSLRRYLMPSRRQPICPVTWLVIWDCSSFVWETGRETVSLIQKEKLTRQKKGDDERGSSALQGHEGGTGVCCLTWCWNMTCPRRRAQFGERMRGKQLNVNSKLILVHRTITLPVCHILYLLFLYVDFFPAWWTPRLQEILCVHCVLYHINRECHYLGIANII